MNIAIIGECMIELSESSRGLSRGFGGDTFNTAVYLKRLSKTLDVHYVTAIGEDPFSQQMLAVFHAENIQTNWVQQINDKLPGLYFIETNAKGERSFYYWRNDAAARYWLQTAQSAEISHQISQADCIYLSGISMAVLPEGDRALLISLLKQSKKKGSKIIFDNNYRKRLWKDLAEAQYWYQQVMALTDTALLTLEDEEALWNGVSLEHVIANAQQFGINELIIKRGEQPCIIVTNEQVIEVAAVKIAADKVIDTTAAGDSFNAGYLAMCYKGASPFDAACFAHQLAATVIQHRGALLATEYMPQLP